ncbi:hypothetical protein DSO57_1000317 [Entomophthora muscae]|uniref:Uncharacterized protein n=1 Tax=Entomophthora muscae TaxID=34485 RepID=A0ACC2TKF4_9FUNG|nr:hypothetical protein DSO57_1000317 [Entomophthora muscae]
MEHLDLSIDTPGIHLFNIQVVGWFTDALCPSTLAEAVWVMKRLGCQHYIFFECSKIPQPVPEPVSTETPTLFGHYKTILFAKALAWVPASIDQVEALNWKAKELFLATSKQYQNSGHNNNGNNNRRTYNDQGAQSSNTQLQQGDNNQPQIANQPANLGDIQQQEANLLELSPEDIVLMEQFVAEKRKAMNPVNTEEQPKKTRIQDLLNPQKEKAYQAVHPIDPVPHLISEDGFMDDEDYLAKLQTR